MKPPDSFCGFADDRGWRETFAHAPEALLFDEGIGRVATIAEYDRLRVVNAAQPNLADPDYEPSDEQITGLMKRGFAGLKDAERVRLERLRSDIAQAREEALARLARGYGR